MKYKIIGRKILRTIIVSTVLGFSGGCQNESFNYPEQLQKYYERSAKYRDDFNTNLNAAHKSLADLSSDGVLNEDEQKKIFRYFDNAKKAKDAFRRNIGELAIENDTEELVWNEGDELKLALLNRNLYGFDGLTPELQKYLKGKGISVKVESCWTKAEQDAVSDALNIFGDIIGSSLDD